MRAAQVSQPNARLEIVERDIPEPCPGEARVRAQAGGVCHSDSFTVQGTFSVAPARALALIPEGLGAIEAGPPLCAGITAYNALRNSGARAGGLVAILGVDRLGHLRCSSLLAWAFAPSPSRVAATRPTLRAS